MINFRTHITILLLGTFLFPLMFQSLHSAHHHAYGHQSEHHDCHIEIARKASAPNHETISQTKDICLVCEFQFSTKDTSITFLLTSVLTAFSFFYQEINSIQYYKLAIAEKSSRAPPVFF